MELQTKPHAKFVNAKESTNFGIKVNRHMFSILSDRLYSNKEMAVVREIISNAVDAHIDAGNQHLSFDVKMPNSLDRTFYVRDYGTGLSHEDMTTLYTTYGESTKTSTNEQIGCLGLGSKSPLAYAESFTSTSYFNGEKRVYSVTMGEHSPVLNLVSVAPTDEPNGLKISLKVQENDMDEFALCVLSVCRFTMIEPNIIGADYEWCDKKPVVYFSNDDFTIFERHPETTYSPNGVMAVMGGVAYTIDLYSLDLNHNTRSFFLYLKYDLAIHFELGELDFPASRERLEMTKRTKSALAEKLEEVKGDIATLVAEKISSIDNLFDWFKEFDSARSSRIQVEKTATFRGMNAGELMNGSDYSINAVVIFELSGLEKDERAFTRYDRMSSEPRRNGASPPKNMMEHYIKLDKLNKSRFIIAEDGVKYEKSRVRNYFANSVGSVERAYVFTEGQAGVLKQKFGLRDDQFMSLSELPRPDRKSGGHRGSSDKMDALKKHGFIQHQGLVNAIQVNHPQMSVQQDQDKVFYIEMNRNDYIYNGKLMRSVSLNTAKDLLVRMGFMSQSDNIYGVRKTARKFVLDDERFVNIVDYLRECIEDSPHTLDIINTKSFQTEKHGILRYNSDVSFIKGYLKARGEHDEYTGEVASELIFEQCFDTRECDYNFKMIQYILGYLDEDDRAEADQIIRNLFAKTDQMYKGVRDIENKIRAIAKKIKNGYPMLEYTHYSPEYIKMADFARDRGFDPSKFVENSNMINRFDIHSPSAIVAALEVFCQSNGYSQDSV